MHTKVRVDDVVIVDDAMKEVIAKDVSEDVYVDVDVVVDEVVVEDVEDEQVGVYDAHVNEEVVVEDNVLEDVEDEVQDVDVEGDLMQWKMLSMMFLQMAKCSSVMLLLRKSSLNPLWVM